MIAKIIQGTSFAGVLTYILGKEEGKAKILYAEGVRQDIHASSIANDFMLQASMRPGVSKPVCHTILSFSKEDTVRLDDKLMNELALQYLKQMGYANTQFLIVRHLDREHPHLHICINRIGNDGKTISDRNEKYRSTKVCKELTETHHLKWGHGKQKVKRERLRGNDKLRYAIYDAITAALPNCKSWRELCTALNKQEIGVQFKTKGKSDEVQGVLFSKDGISISGSHIDRSCSYSKISYTLNHNREQMQNTPTHQNDALPTSVEWLGNIENEVTDFIGGLFESNGPAVDVAELLFQRKLRNKAKVNLKRRRL